MKTARMLLFASLFLLSVFLIESCAPRKYVPKTNEEINGTWINEKIAPQKVVNSPSGWKEYSYASDAVPLDEGNGGIDSKWTDSEGNIWYRTFSTVTSATYKGTKTQGLEKISKSGKVYESVFNIVAEFDPKNYPTKIDPKDSNYRIYYRAKE